ncbi:toll/interleukin-1 receptor domain-containing protein [Pseudomonas sp. GLN_3]|uniref:toll/interleukin-1 receptor domain-containing protein n=1 Tax=Pseudomonas sp. GLN_3 TaxID=3367181 RepID=UPI00370B11EB
MSQKLLFISHIHEEKAIAILIKNAIEEEFGGFVDVFVSSDGTSIPAGANFLKRIEDGLICCIGAIYLISPNSVKRNWINFELGAVWVRNAINIREGRPEIPTLPFCHSGITPSGLPAPLNNLNGISSTEASQLEFAFRSIQSAVGGRGKLRTDFDNLAAQILTLELQYTLGENLKKMVKILGGDARGLIEHCKKQQSGSNIFLNCGFIDTNVIQQLKELEARELKGQITISTNNPGINFGVNGATNGADVNIAISADLVLKFESLLLS